MKAKVLPLVVLVENDIGVCRTVMDELTRRDYEVWAMSTFDGVLYAVHKKETRQIVMLIDHKFHDLVRVLNYVKREVRHSVVVLVWGQDITIDVKRMVMVEHNAYDVLDKNIIFDDLLIYIERGQQYLQEFIQSHKDSMTGLPRRAPFFIAVAAKLKAARNRWNPKDVCSLIFFDLDDLKKINDTYDYLTGDKAIKEFARVIKKGVRSSDDICRYGGDEFLAILWGVDEAKANTVAKKIQEKISARQFVLPAISISASFGVVELRKEDIEQNVMKTLASLISRADMRLKEDKAKSKQLELQKKEAEHQTA